MSHWINYLLTSMSAFLAMECIAWFAHKYIMHGFLWSLHHDHHQRDDRGFFEKNDYFFLIFGLPGISLIGWGTFHGFGYDFWTGVGISLYGFAYFFVHDIFIHQRFKIFRNSNSVYLRAIRRAHKMHHKHLGKEHGECFGMLWVPLHYFLDELKRKAS
ncbi:MAG: beta-carotene hydroxylase [Bacteroidetes bacterium]|nr:beta-carotene hydroxylase [Bacteroidota bacterium]